MAYQRGSLKQVSRKRGNTWVLRYRVSTGDGRRVENIHTIGPVCDFPTKADAWREVDKLGLPVRINDASARVRIRFDVMAEHYLRVDFGTDAVRPKSVTTVPIVEHYVRDYLIARWQDQVAEDIKPLEIQRWLKYLHTDNGLAWTTVSKIRGIMLRIYKVGIRHELVTKNPVLHVETRCKSLYRAIIVSPHQTLTILRDLGNILYWTLVLTCAATALRAS